MFQDGIQSTNQWPMIWLPSGWLYDVICRHITILDGEISCLLEKCRITIWLFNIAMENVP